MCTHSECKCMSMGSDALNGTEVMGCGTTEVLPLWLMQCATASRRVNVVPSRHIIHTHVGSSTQQCMLQGNTLASAAYIIMSCWPSSFVAFSSYSLIALSSVADMQKSFSSGVLQPGTDSFTCIFSHLMTAAGVNNHQANWHGRLP